MINYSCIEFTACFRLYMSGPGVNLTRVENGPYITENFLINDLTVKISSKMKISPLHSLKNEVNYNVNSQLPLAKK